MRYLFTLFRRTGRRGALPDPLFLSLAAVFCFLFINAAAAASFPGAGFVIDAAAALPGGQPVSGTITDQNGNPLPGVTVKDEKTGQGTVTDASGKFTLVTDGDAALAISFIGYQSVDIPLKGKREVHVRLKPQASGLNEVVVVGYGTQDKKTLTASVTSIDESRIADKPSVDVNKQLQGRVAGLQVNSYTGVPGDGLFLRIRGTTSINASNDPLYVVDGVPVNNESLQQITTEGQANSPLADINPADIQSISILKDATATAIYGARGANGVVVITTKRGFDAERPHVDFQANVGWAWAPKLWDLVTGPEHAEIINEAWVNDGKPYDTRPFRPVTDGGRGLPEDQKTYDRLHDIFRTGLIHNYNLSISGGNERTHYYLGAGYTSQQAEIKTNDYQRASLKINLDQRISDHIKIGTSNLLSRAYRDNARVGDGPKGGILQSALHTPTYLPKYNDDGSYAKWAGFDNIEVLIKYTDMHSTSLHYIGNVYAEADIVPGLKFRTSWSLDYDNYDEYQYWNSFTNLGAANHNYGQSAITGNTIWTNEQTLSYSRQFSGGSELNVLAGNTLEGTTDAETIATGSNFPNDSYKQIASAATTTSSSSTTASRLTSFFSRINYGFDSRYYLEVNFRADASSRFGTDYQWGYFPSVGGAWRVKEESFLKDATFLSDLKLRASYGVTGNQNGINDFASRGLWGAGANYEDNPGTVPDQLANPDLKWESTRQVNLGINAAFLHNRLTAEVNLYDKKTTGLLLSVPLPKSSGYASMLENDGAMGNRGYELALHSVNVKNRRFRWGTTLTLSGNRNKILKLTTPLSASYEAERMIQGYPMYSFYVYKQLYVDPKTGDAVYDDVNKDGQLTADDREIVGNAWPKVFGGLTNDFSYRNFDLSVFFNFEYGNKVYNNNRYFLESGGTRDDRRAIDKNQLNAWQKPGDKTDVPRITTIGYNYTLSPISRFIEDGSFLRLSTLTLGYTLPQVLLSRLRLSNARVYYTASNLWLLTKYSGPDPEVNVTANPTTQGYDLGTPPQPRVMEFGLNLSF